jgi:hypothetical protein
VIKIEIPQSGLVKHTPTPVRTDAPVEVRTDTQAYRETYRSIQTNRETYQGSCHLLQISTTFRVTVKQKPTKPNQTKPNQTKGAFSETTGAGANIREVQICNSIPSGGKSIQVIETMLKT